MEGGGIFDTDKKVKFYNPRWVSITPEIVEVLRLTHQNKNTAPEPKCKADAFDYIIKVALRAGLYVEGSAIGEFEDKEITKKEIADSVSIDYVTISK